MSKFSASDAAFVGFRLVREHPKTIGVWAVLMTVLSLASTALTNRLAGLDNYHSRPEEEIVSNVATNPLGDLAIVGSGERALGAIDAGEARIRVSGNESRRGRHYCR